MQHLIALVALATTATAVAAPSCSWPANYSRLQCDMDLGRSVAGSPSPQACMATCTDPAPAP